MDVQHGLELFVGHFLNDVVPDIAGVVDDDVERAKGGDGGVHQLLGEVRRREIPNQPLRASACLGGSLLQRHFVNIREHHRRAACREFLGHGASNAASRSGDQRGFAFEGERSF